MRATRVERMEHMDAKLHHEVEETLMATFARFGESSTSHGLPRIFTSKSYFWKLTWMMVFLTFTGICCWQVLLVFQNYFDYPVDVRLSIQHGRQVEFPSVTICNLNPLRVKKLTGTRFEALYNISQTSPESLPGQAPAGPPGQVPAGPPLGSGNQPAQGGSQPAQGGSQPAQGGSQPAQGGSQPAQGGSQPAQGGSQPAQGGSQPAQSGSPATTAGGQPTTAGGQPTTVGGQPTTAGGQPTTAGGQPTTAGGQATQAGIPPTTAGTQSTTPAGGAAPPPPPGRRKRQAIQQPPNQQQLPVPPTPPPIQQQPPINLDQQMSSLRQQISSGNDYWGLMVGSQVSDLSDISSFLTPTVEEILAYGHQADDFILQCSFNQVACTSADFHVIPNRKHGLCYTFNHGIGEDLINTTQYGAQSGLKLTLNPDRDQYIGLFSQEVGVRVLIHKPLASPFPEELGQVATPQRATSFSIKQQVIKKLPTPYGDCIENPPATYSLLNCTKECLYDMISERCGCEDRLVTSDWNKTCSFIDDTQYLCVRSIYKQYYASNISCEQCKQPCHDVNYATEASSSEWPSRQYWTALQLVQAMGNASANNSATSWLTNGTYKDNGLVRVFVYFQELNYEYIEENPGYPFERLMSDIGGTMGLYVGISFCTFFEVVELAISVLFAMFKRMATPKQEKKTKIRPMTP